jgi:hypothetical protein
VSDTRYLILAEGFSTDPHYGKTMRGVLRYRRDDVVAILDSTRAPGETEDGVPVVQTVIASFRPEHRTRRRRDPGWALPAGVDRPAEELHHERAARRERLARVSRRRR